MKSNYPYLLIFHEKHGSRHFLINSEVDLHKVALTVVKQRIEEGWYDIFEPEEPKCPKRPDDNAEGYVQRAYTKELESYKFWRKEYFNQKELWELLQKINKNDGEAAYQLLEIRSNHEYEGTETEFLENFE